MREVIPSNRNEGTDTTRNKKKESPVKICHQCLSCKQKDLDSPWASWGPGRIPPRIARLKMGGQPELSSIGPIPSWMRVTSRALSSWYTCRMSLRAWTWHDRSIREGPWQTAERPWYLLVYAGSSRWVCTCEHSCPTPAAVAEIRRGSRGYVTRSQRHVAHTHNNSKNLSLTGEREWFLWRQ